MYKSFLTFLAAGSTKNLGPEDWKKVVAFLEDNPDAVVVLRTHYILLFSKKNELKIRRSLWHKVEDFEREFGIKVIQDRSTDTFYFCRINSPEIGEMEELAVDVSGQTQSCGQAEEARSENQAERRDKGAKRKTAVARSKAKGR